MSSGADLFVVCKQCGSEVSPYITECPYCGHRLRRRAPKLPRPGAAAGAAKSRAKLGSLAPARLWRGTAPRRASRRVGTTRYAAAPPRATIALVAAGIAGWLVWHAEPLYLPDMFIAGGIHGRWWTLLSSQFWYGSGVYAFAVLFAVAIFGWLLERRHGPFVVLALFLGAGVAGALVAVAAYPFAEVSGGNAGALALLGAWVAPELRASERGPYDDADLLGAGVIAALLLALPFAVFGTSWLAGVCGAAIGLLLGTGLHRMQKSEL